MTATAHASPVAALGQVERSTRSLRIQLWSYNYDPEPTGIGPVSTGWAHAMRDRGHRVEVVAAHPHYPSAEWGDRFRPYRERRAGIPVLRLPLWIGRDTGIKRLRQELTYATALAAAAPLLGRPDVIISVSPSFPALAPAMVYSRYRRVPWVLWLQDILPDGAAATGLVESGMLLDAARRLERAAYRAAARVVVISRTHARNLVEKGVPRSRLVRIFNPATRTPPTEPAARDPGSPRIFTMGNIGHSQGLDGVVRAFEACPDSRVRDSRLVIAGHGVAVESVRAQIRSDRVEMPGLVSDVRLEHELAAATVGLVSQRPDIAEFNLPSKLSNLMAYGLPVVAAVRPDSEVAKLVREARAGWVTSEPTDAGFCHTLAEALRDPEEIVRRGEAARAYARSHFDQASVAAAFESMLVPVARLATR